MKMTHPQEMQDEIRHFWDQGYLVVKGAFTPQEMAVVREVVERHQDMRKQADHAKVRSTGPTRPSFETLFVWNDTAGDDVFAKATRSHKVMDRLEAIFGDEVYVYHNKVALKYPGVVGFSYHQDYAYWYKMGNLFPDMASVFIAVDRATKENGCLRVVAGSHKLGRLDHVERDGVSDSGVDPARLEQVLKVLPEVALELDPGDIVFFHCNTLHASADNRSDHSRLALLGCFNTRHNDPYLTVHGHPNWHKQEKVLDPITAGDLGNLPQFKRE